MLESITSIFIKKDWRLTGVIQSSGIKRLENSQNIKIISFLDLINGLFCSVLGTATGEIRDQIDSGGIRVKTAQLQKYHCSKKGRFPTFSSFLSIAICYSESQSLWHDIFCQDRALLQWKNKPINPFPSPTSLLDKNNFLWAFLLRPPNPNLSVLIKQK